MWVRHQPSTSIFAGCGRRKGNETPERGTNTCIARNVRRNNCFRPQKKVRRTLRTAARNGSFYLGKFRIDQKQRVSWNFTVTSRIPLQPSEARLWCNDFLHANSKNILISSPYFAQRNLRRYLSLPSFLRLFRLTDNLALQSNRTTRILHPPSRRLCTRALSITQTFKSDETFTTSEQEKNVEMNWQSTLWFTLFWSVYSRRGTTRTATAHFSQRFYFALFRLSGTSAMPELSPEWTGSSVDIRFIVQTGITVAVT